MFACMAGILSRANPYRRTAPPAYGHKAGRRAAPARDFVDHRRRGAGDQDLRIGAFVLHPLPHGAIVNMRRPHNEVVLAYYGWEWLIFILIAARCRPCGPKSADMRPQSAIFVDLSPVSIGFKQSSGIYGIRYTHRRGHYECGQQNTRASHGTSFLGSIRTLAQLNRG